MPAHAPPFPPQDECTKPLEIELQEAINLIIPILNSLQQLFSPIEIVLQDHKFPQRYREVTRLLLYAEGLGRDNRALNSTEKCMRTVRLSENF